MTPPWGHPGRGRPDRPAPFWEAGNLTRYCEQLAAAGVLLLPGSVYDQPGHIRIGFGRANMPDALNVLEANLATGQHRTSRPRA